MTDSTGSYRVAGLGDNDYYGEFSKDGFSDTRMNERVHVAGSVPARADAQIQPWGALHGRVVDDEGKPAAGVRVECGCTRDGAVTDENGGFSFQDLRPGSYTLVAKPEPKIRMQDGVRLGTVAIYYPSATEPAQAARIPVRVGENVSGVEIRLKSVPVHRVAGVVLGATGKPVAHATVKLMGRAGGARQPIIFSGSSYTIGPAPEPEVARIESLEDGTFEFVAVEPGDWRLSAESGVDDDMPLGGVASVLVSEKDVEDVRVRLAAPFPVQVTTDWGSAQAPAHNGYGWSPVMLMPMEGQPPVIVDPATNVGRINGILPGRYRVTPMGTGLEFYASAVMWEGRDVAGQAVEFAAGAAPLQVIFKSGAGKVRGTVERGEGSLVMLVPRDAAETSMIRTARCGAAGSFEIDGVVPGDYYIVAFDRSDERGVQWDGLLEAIVPIASNVRVEAGSTASVDLRMNGWPF
jgi:hypothetical protein